MAAEPEEVTVSRARGAPTMVVCCVSGGESNAANCPGSAASWYAGRVAPSAAAPGMTVTDAGWPPAGARTGWAGPAARAIADHEADPTYDGALSSGATSARRGIGTAYVKPGSGRPVGAGPAARSGPR